ncbi:MAG TPA: oligosaccharide flippase family protein [Gaiellaceae bacterium]|nr:oligosaccharide flippase family protein [Gaiellaceae bacterium]
MTHLGPDAVQSAAESQAAAEGPHARLGARVARNLAFLAAGRGTAAVLQFAAFAVIAAHLGPELLGVYTFAVAIVALFRIVPAFGFEQIVPRDVAQRPEDEMALVPNVVYLRVLLAGAAYALLAGAVFVVGYESRSREAALVAGLALLLVAGETLRASLATRLRLGWSAVADFLEAVVTLVGAVALTAAGYSVLPLLVLYVVAKLTNVAVVIGAATSVASYDWRPTPSLWWPAIRAAAPLAATTLVISVYYRLDVVVLARIAPTDDVGQYGLALKFLDAVVLLTAVVMAVLQPVLARSVVEGLGSLRRRYARAVGLMTALAIPTGIAGAMTAWRIVPALPGLSQYEGAGIALALLSPAAALILVATVVQGTLLAAHRERTLLRIALGGLATNIVLIAALIPPFSYVGAAAATTLTELALIVLTLAAARRLGLGWPLERARSLATATFVLVLALLPGYLVHPFLQAAGGVAAFAFAAVLTGTVRPAEVREVLGRPA